MQCTFLVACCLLAVCGLATEALLNNFNPRRALLDHLIEKSDCEVPPQPDQLPIKVQVSMKLMRIVDICPEIQCVKIFALEMYNWTDPRLKWNPDNFGGIDAIPVDIDHLWLPDIDIAGDKSGKSMQKRFRDDKATVLSTGSVLLIAPQKLEILCNGTVWQQSVKSGGSGSGSSSSSGGSARTTRDQRQRQIQLRKKMSSSGSSSSSDAATYVCEFFQTSWMYDTDIVEVVLAGGDDEESSSSSSRSREMRIRQGGPSSSSSSQYGESTEYGDNSENNYGDNEETATTTMGYPWRRRSNSQSSSRRQQKSSSSNKKGSNKKPVPFSQWTTTASDELFEPNDKYDLASFTARREFNSLPYAPDRQWSTIYYQIGIISKMPELDGEMSSKGSKMQQKKKQQQQQQQEEEEDDDDDEEQQQQQQQQMKAKAAELKRGLRASGSSRQYNSYQQPEENIVQEEEDD